VVAIRSQHVVVHRAAVSVTLHQVERSSKEVLQFEQRTKKRTRNADRSGALRVLLCCWLDGCSL